MEILPLPALKDNYIWLIPNKANSHVVIVDPGDAEPVIKYLEKNELTLAGILVTHHHWDHTNGIAELLDYAGNIAVIGGRGSQCELVNHSVDDGDEIICEHVNCRAISIPGHTMDHTAFYNETDGFVFTGDTLFSAGCGRIFEGTPGIMYDSLQKLAALPDHTKVYCGHEYTRANLKFASAAEPSNQHIKQKTMNLPPCTLPSTIGEEKLINPFLRCEQGEIIAAAEHFSSHTLPHPVNVFASLREWKNNFS